MSDEKIVKMECPDCLDALKGKELGYDRLIFKCKNCKRKWIITIEEVNYKE